MRAGRTIAERREQLETSSERLKAREKVKRKKTLRLVLAILWVVAFVGIIGYAIAAFINRESELNAPVGTNVVVVPYAPTIEIIDVDAAATGNQVTSRMREYIGQVEADLRELGYIPTKAVIPSGAVREVDIYIDGYSGYVKMVIDRGTGVSAEDTDRMIRYLKGRGISDFEYIDVRIEGKGYWK